MPTRDLTRHLSRQVSESDEVPGVVKPDRFPILCGERKTTLVTHVTARRCTFFLDISKFAEVH